MESITFVSHQPTLQLNTAIENFVQSQPFPATIKNAKTGQYTACNETVSSLAGLKPEEYVGLTAYDVGTLTQGKREFTENAINMDRQIISEITPFVRYKHVWFIKKKTIFIEEVIKRPIFGATQKIVGILAYGRDITALIDLTYLFSLYEAHHHTIQEAITYFLQAINLHRIFHDLPTQQELMVLLAMSQANTISEVAEKLKLTPQIIKNNQAKLAEKLKFIGLDEVLIRLKYPEEYRNKALG